MTFGPMMEIFVSNIKITIKKHRRAKRKSSKNIQKPLRLLGVNSAGIRSKLLTFKKVLNDLKPGVFFIQETKLKDTDKLKFDEYIVFEKVRQNRDGGGGLALGALKELHPVWVKEGDKQVEALSINISIQNLKIRCCVAYGCQESDSNEKKE